MKQIFWKTVHLREAGTTINLNDPKKIQYSAQIYLIQALTKGTAVPTNTEARRGSAGEKAIGREYYTNSKILLG